MSEHQQLIDSYAQLASDGSLKGREPDMVADALNDTADTEHEVVVLEEWLVDDKDVRPLPGAARIYVGEIVRETEKAIQLDQGDCDDWIPKSCSTTYTTQPGATIETPQTGLGSYAAAEDGHAAVGEVVDDV